VSRYQQIFSASSLKRSSQTETMYYRPDAFAGGFEVVSRSIVYESTHLHTHRCLGLSILSLNSSGTTQLQQYLHGTRADPLLGHLQCHRLLGSGISLRNCRKVSCIIILLTSFTFHNDTTSLLMRGNLHFVRTFQVDYKLYPVCHSLFPGLLSLQGLASFYLQIWSVSGT
jgi:hypothetical protein